MSAQPWPREGDLVTGTWGTPALGTGRSLTGRVFTDPINGFVTVVPPDGRTRSFLLREIRTPTPEELAAYQLVQGATG